MKLFLKKLIARIGDIGPPIPTPAERAIEREELLQRIATGPRRFDHIKRLNALDGLDGDWGCKLLRVLAYKLHRSDD
ncbi:hypothetical protein [Burkholderia sp. LMU1-1-1.1]|uniref:hypothetical protein n=1 Tax=Burkholderia sp. LMU1-1-1.1 TaxID=3135266 RepID=UPI003413D641